VLVALAGRQAGTCSASCVNILLHRDEGTGEWRKIHDEELNDLYSSPNIFSDD
jgi:hypothetical protein